VSEEAYLSVDIETAGPVPGEFAMLSIGACDFDGRETFQCKLKPTTRNAVPEALKVSGLSLDDLARDGLEPRVAMSDFSAWIGRVAGSRTPVFVGFNAPFDWSFVNYYFHKYLGHNPFGFTALDIKALYMGVEGGSWAETRSSVIAKKLHPKSAGDHDALHDAIYQAELFRLILAARSRT
jgi:DNA polymerase III epsilon subunit-like protein